MHGCGRDPGPQNPADGGARRDESEQPLALLNVKHVDHQGPEHGDHEQVEDRGPDEEGATDPYV